MVRCPLEVPGGLPVLTSSRTERDEPEVSYEPLQARAIQWPPVQSGSVGRDCPAYAHQVAATAFLDKAICRLLSQVPENTIVVICADHGECFGEDGFWGHGFNHPKVLEVPLLICRLDGRALF